MQVQDDYKQKTLGAYPIPKEVPYSSLSTEELEKLDAWTDKACRVTALRVCKKTGGDVEFDSVYNYLLYERHLMSERIARKEVGKHNVCNYFQQGIWNRGIKFIQKYWDDASVDRVLEEQAGSYARLAGNGYEEGETKRIIRIIGKAADKLGIEVDPEDLVATTKKVIKEGVHKGRLTGWLFAEVNEVAGMMSLAKYEKAQKRAAGQGSGRGHVYAAVKEVVEENPHASTSQIWHLLKDRGLTKSKDSLKTTAVRVRRDLGISDRRTAGSSLLWNMWDLFNEGVTEIADMRSSLRHKAIPFRPSYVMKILRAFKKGYTPESGYIREIRMTKEDKCKQ